MPEDYASAVDVLLSLCPELDPAWQHLYGWMEEDTGIYSVTGHIVLPLLHYALDGHAQPGEVPDWLLDMNRDTRQRFRDQSAWQAIPDRGSAELDDLIDRVYEAIDLWARSRNRQLREAVYIEFLETGYVDLTRDDLIERAGPGLLSLQEDWSVGQ